VRAALAVILLFAAACTPRGETRLEINWSQQALPAGGSLVACGTDCQALHVELAPQSSPLALLRLDSPPVEGGRYALLGRIRHERVAQPGYLELWNVFADGSRYFTRTLAQSGPMATLAGDADWKPLALPFDATGATAELVALELNAVLPGGGVIELEPLRLVQY
jgi:hypothetical protein